tara:strand:- start:795 stop:1208 length:414 start_codon:yes stop_codon:yes gene_type:complete
MLSINNTTTYSLLGIQENLLENIDDLTNSIDNMESILKNIKFQLLLLVHNHTYSTKQKKQLTYHLKEFASLQNNLHDWIEKFSEDLNETTLDEFKEFTETYKNTLETNLFFKQIKEEVNESTKKMDEVLKDLVFTDT